MQIWHVSPFSFVFQTIYIYKEHTLTLYYCIQRSLKIMKFLLHEMFPLIHSWIMNVIKRKGSRVKKSLLIYFKLMTLQLTLDRDYLWDVSWSSVLFCEKLLN